jgi:putative sugar O-methyltransferase
MEKGDSASGEQKMAPLDPSTAIKNDRQLLKVMINDLRVAGEFYKPGPYWEGYESWILSWLMDNDLNQFRSTRAPALRSFGGGSRLGFHYEDDLPVLLRLLSTNTITIRLLSKLFSLLAKLNRAFLFFHPRVIESMYQVSSHGKRVICALAYYAAQLLDRDRELVHLQDSGLGNPSELFTRDGRQYTLSFLSKFSQYLYVKSHVDFGMVTFVLEIGSGIGMQAEVLLKAQPHLTICIVDIPPQLYVAQQYLAACFGAEVCGYEITRQMEHIGKSVFERYRVICLAPWQIPRMRDVAFEVFWNSASFHEMEPHLVKNYLGMVRRLVTDWVYLMEVPEGKKGTNERVTLEHYTEYLPDFELVDLTAARLIPEVFKGDSYRHMMFRRREGTIPC